MSHLSSRLTVSQNTPWSPLFPIIYHISPPLQQLCALRYAPPIITSHCPSNNTVLSVMPHQSSSLTAPPRTLLSPLCPTIHHDSLPLHQNCALRYVSQLITSPSLSTNNMFSVMSHHSSRLTDSPPTLCPLLCPAFHHVSMSLQQNCALRYVPPFITSHCLSTNIVTSVMS